MSQYTRYLIDIRHPGQKFQELITNFGIGHIPGVSPAKLKDIQNQIYRESGNQIFDEMTHNTAMFLQALTNMPRFNYFDQYEVLFQDNNLRQIFTNGFREFAMALLYITFQKIPITPNLTFYLESIGPEYMSIVSHPKSLQHQ